MNVRVSAIILVAAIFMAVWDADQQGIAKDRQRIARARAAASALVATAATPLPVVATAVRQHADNQQTASPSTDSSPDQCVPLPSRLAAGTWQVVDETGRQTRITIHAEPQLSAEHSFCIVSGEHGRRWCFVRVNDEKTAELSGDSSRQ
ncbi:MAG: hypothetical protein ACKO3T_02290 [Planctomycetaceae bacterium]